MNLLWARDVIARQEAIAETSAALSRSFYFPLEFDELFGVNESENRTYTIYLYEQCVYTHRDERRPANIFRPRKK